MIIKRPLGLFGRRYVRSFTAKDIHSHKNFTLSAITCTSCEVKTSCKVNRILRQFHTALPTNAYKCINNTLVGSSLKHQIIYRGKAATSYQEQIINEFIASHNEATTEQWQKLMDRVLELSYGLITESNIDAKIVDTCIFPHKLELARSYLLFVRSSGRKFNSALVCAFLRLCFAERKLLDEKDRARIDRFTEFLLTRYKVMDTTVGEAIIKGLILSGKGDKCPEILHDMEKINSVTASTNSAYSIYLIESNQPNQALEYSRRFIEQTEKPDLEFYSTWFEFYKNDRCKLEESLLLLRTSDIKVDNYLCEIFTSTFKALPPKERLEGTITTIDNTGRCNNCNTRLNNLELTDEEFNGLKNTFLNRVLVGTDIFQNTNPEELEHFRFQVARHAPFDLVIDGLNVAYMSGISVGPLASTNILMQTLRYYHDKGKKVFLIGRKHMCGWPTLMDKLKDLKIGYFLIDNVSEDDPFIIYSTMYSGRNTCFVTRDLLRSEKFGLASMKDQLLFKRWQLRRQIIIKFISSSGKLYTEPQIDFDMMAQKSITNGWHLPYVDKDIPSPTKEEYGIHRKWYCLFSPLTKVYKQSTFTEFC